MSEEPLGVMKCWECVEKHARDLEHHLEDIIRVETDPKKRLEYNEDIDFIRQIRKKGHALAKGIAIEDVGVTVEREPTREDVIHFSEPIRVERGEKTYVEVFHEKEECHPSSFRTVKPDEEHLVTICCPVGHYDEASGRCLVGTMGQKIHHIHPEGQTECPSCSAA